MQRIFAEYLQIFFFYDIFAYNMALINPFKHLEHKVYNRTFMRNASADIEYAEVSLSANAGAISKFLQDNFNTGLNSLNNNQFEAIKVSANERQLSYNFSKTHATVIIGARDYESFASSMQPCIGKLTQFLNVVGTPKVTKVTLRKQNVWEISSENARNSYKAATWYIFADEKIRGEFYDALCVFGRALTAVVNSEKAYAAFDKEEINKYKSSFVFYSKLRRSVKIRYADAIDNREYEKQMQNLLDTHLSVKDIKQITNPVDILNEGELEKELEELGSMRSKADSIVSHMTRSIKANRDENPAYYDSFSNRIKQALEDYKNRVISEAEYLDKMKSIMADYRKGNANITYPEKIKGNVHAQAFYGVIAAIIDDKININENIDIISDIALEVTSIIQKHDTVDWQTNKEIHNKIAQEIDDLFYRLEKEQNFVIDFDTIDKIIENVITVALRRFK